MAQFVKMENGNLLNVSCIAQICPYARINCNSKRLKVDASIIVEGSEFGGNLIEAIAVVPWPNPYNDVEAYNLSCGERKNLEKAIMDLFPQIVRGISSDLKIYYPSIAIRGQLERAAKGTAKRIVKAAQKMEAENE